MFEKLLKFFLNQFILLEHVLRESIVFISKINDRTVIPTLILQLIFPKLLQFCLEINPII
jgi:hypothetical protein